MISIVIPTLGRQNLLRKTIASIHELKSSINFEILVCDNESSQDTIQVVELFKKRAINIRYFAVDKPGLHEGRHEGFKNSKYDIIAFLDDDVEVTKDWLQSVFTVFEDKRVGLVGGKCLPKFESPPPEWLLNQWKANKIIPELSIIDSGEKIKATNPYHVFGCNFIIRKKVLEQTKGFHPDAMKRSLLKYRGDGESYVASWLKNQKKWKTLYHPGASVLHWVSNERMTEEYMEFSCFKAGISSSYTWLRLKRPNTATLVVRFVKSIKQYMLTAGYNRARLKGVIYHQSYYLISQKVREWVQQEHYL